MGKFINPFHDQWMDLGSCRVQKKSSQLNCTVFLLSKSTSHFYFKSIDLNFQFKKVILFSKNET